MGKSLQKVRERGKTEWIEILAGHPTTAAEIFCSRLSRKRLREGLGEGIVIEHLLEDYPEDGKSTVTISRIRAEQSVRWFYDPQDGEEE
jgi:hypothetical protein